MVATSLLRHRIGPRVWRAVHWAAYACWPVALAARPGHRHRRRHRLVPLEAIGCVAVVTAAVGWRLAGYAERGQHRVARRLPTALLEEVTR